MNLLASSGQLRASFMRWALVCVPATVLLGFLSAKTVQSGPDNPWFAALAKPAVYPPPITFEIVWTTLYILMGLALAQVLSARGARGRALAIVVFTIQFVLNIAWSPVFFGAHLLAGSFVLIVLLDFAVLLTLGLFWKVRPGAGALLAPYLAWILFATYLNFAVLQANPSMDGASGSGAAVRYAI